MVQNDTGYSNFSYIIPFIPKPSKYQNDDFIMSYQGYNYQSTSIMLDNDYLENKDYVYYDPIYVTDGYTYMQNIGDSGASQYVKKNMYELDIHINIPSTDIYDISNYTLSVNTIMHYIGEKTININYEPIPIINPGSAIFSFSIISIGDNDKDLNWLFINDYKDKTLLDLIKSNTLNEFKEIYICGLNKIYY